jgi:hypothetical protein
MAPADRRRPAPWIPPHKTERFPAPCAVRLSQERWPETPGEASQVEYQQETNQDEPDDDMRSGHTLLYPLIWAEGTLCVILDRAVFRRVRIT